jgi:hypothetical protein
MLLLSLYRGLAYVLLASVFCFTANADTTTDALAQIPACGVRTLSHWRRTWLTVLQLQCIITNLPKIGCDLLDTECQCTSKNSTKILQPCLERMCTYDETFSMFVFIPASASGIANIVAAILRAQAAICNRPHDSLSIHIKVTAYVTGIIPIVVIIMRFTSRYLGGNKIWWDDWLHLASVVSTQSTRPSAHTYDCARSWSSP